MILVENLHNIKIWNKWPTFDIDKHLPHSLNLSPLLYFSRLTLSVWFNIFSVHHVLQYNSGVLYQLYIVHQAQEWHKKAKGKRLRNAHTLSIDTYNFFLLSEIGDISKQWLLLKILSHIWICVEGQYIYIECNSIPELSISTFCKSANLWIFQLWVALQCAGLFSIDVDLLISSSGYISHQ